ncbi:MAG: polyphosphate kinase 2 [Xanthomonadales bacterium]|nr:polyphosphate kinase 2 [Xanthomonadales bacterium]
MAHMKRKAYEESLEALQDELIDLQRWVSSNGKRIAIVFEGRDAAGKGGVIKAIEAPLNDRLVRRVALPKPTERQQGQWYFQRYIEHLPAAGEIVLFDRSWYNRAGVEHVMGFCTDAQYRQFLLDCPEFERLVTRDGLILLKYWLAVDQAEQEQRFAERASDPRKRWKLSPVDVKARADYAKYGQSRDAMLEATHARQAPWFVVDFNDQRRGRLNLIAHLLKQLPAREPAPPAFDLPKLAGKPQRERVPKKYLIRETY